MSILLFSHWQQCCRPRFSIHVTSNPPSPIFGSVLPFWHKSAVIWLRVKFLKSSLGKRLSAHLLSYNAKYRACRQDTENYAFWSKRVPGWKQSRERLTHIWCGRSAASDHTCFLEKWTERSMQSKLMWGKLFNCKYIVNDSPPRPIKRNWKSCQDYNVCSVLLIRSNPCALSRSVFLNIVLNFVVDQSWLGHTGISIYFLS